LIVSFIKGRTDARAKTESGQDEGQPAQFCPHCGAATGPTDKTCPSCSKEL
jgi:uncharacterized OB-fold protein